MAKEKSKRVSRDSRRVATTGDIEVSTYLEIAKEISGEQPAAIQVYLSNGLAITSLTLSAVVMKLRQMLE